MHVRTRTEQEERVVHNSNWRTIHLVHTILYLLYSCCTFQKCLVSTVRFGLVFCSYVFLSLSHLYSPQIGNVLGYENTNHNKTKHDMKSKH